MQMRISFFKNSPRYLAAARLLDTVRCLDIDDGSRDGVSRQETPDGKGVWVIHLCSLKSPGAALYVYTDRRFMFHDPVTKNRTRFTSIQEVQTFLLKKFFT